VHDLLLQNECNLVDTLGILPSFISQGCVSLPETLIHEMADISWPMKQNCKEFEYILTADESIDQLYGEISKNDFESIS